MRRITEGPPRPFNAYMPPFLKETYGTWISHRILEPGVIEHTSSSGSSVYSVRAAATPNARYSTGTVRKLSELARKYSGGSLRFTQALNIEFVTAELNDALKLKEELDQLGFPVGGWGGHLWSITSCAGYFHCALAATDAPSIAQAIGNKLFVYFRDRELPAKLAISASGCPSSCGGGFLADINVSGIHTEVPVVTEDVKNCDLQGTAFSCPVGAIQLKTLQSGQKTLEIREHLCIGCGLCVGACGGIIFRTPEKTDGHCISIGGKASASRYGTTLGRIVVPFLPNDPPHYPRTMKAVGRIVDTWKNDAVKGERIADWIDRIGWEKFFGKTGLPFFEQSMDYFDLRGITTLREGSGR